MKSNQFFGFLLSLVATGWILHLLSYDEKKVSLGRMEHVLRQERLLKEEIGSRCSALTGREDTKQSRFFVDRLSPDTLNSTAPACALVVRSASLGRFQLRAYWKYTVQLARTDGKIFLERSFNVEFPRPLCFLPIAALLLALIFEITHFGLGWTMVTYLLLTGGGNLIRTFGLALRSSWLTFTTDPSFVGLLLVAAWLALYRSNHGERHGMGRQVRPAERFASRAAALLIGLWNPGAYTLLGRLLYPMQNRLARLLPFFDAQLVVTGLSLYLLNLDMHSLLPFLQESFLLPRYFTFALILFFAFAYPSMQTQREANLWRLPHLWRPLFFVACTEILALKLALLAAYPTLVRVGGALILSELVWPVGISLPRAWKQFYPWAGALFAASFITVFSHQSGIVDLFQVLWEPRVHPTGLVLFTFIAGIVLGFLTGNFSATYFALFPVILAPHQNELVKAALLDGILAGTVLSPFSVFNLLPAVQFEMRIQQLVALRFRQLALPLGIGGAIFAVSAINSVAILRPVTFVFLVLVGLALRLKKGAWRLGRFSLDTPMKAGA